MTSYGNDRETIKLLVFSLTPEKSFSSRAASSVCLSFPVPSRGNFDRHLMTTALECRHLKMRSIWNYQPFKIRQYKSVWLLQKMSRFCFKIFKHLCILPCFYETVLKITKDKLCQYKFHSKFLHVSDDRTILNWTHLDFLPNLVKLDFLFDFSSIEILYTDQQIHFDIAELLLTFISFFSFEYFNYFKYLKYLKI